LKPVSHIGLAQGYQAIPEQGSIDTGLVQGRTRRRAQSSPRESDVKAAGCRPGAWCLVTGLAHALGGHRRLRRPVRRLPSFRSTEPSSRASTRAIEAASQRFHNHVQNTLVTRAKHPELVVKSGPEAPGTARRRTKGGEPEI
jgi:hypothetical protein